jgi:hypothetical protein
MAGKVQHLAPLAQTDHTADLVPYHAQLANLALVQQQWPNHRQVARYLLAKLVINFRMGNANNADQAFIARLARLRAQLVA